MKKKIWLVSAMAVLLLLWGMFVLEQSRMVQFAIDGDSFFISIMANNKETKISPWYDDTEDVYYFFLPSCVQNRKIYFDSIKDNRIVIGGELITKWDYLGWVEQSIYNFKIDDSSHQIIFMKSENIPAFFIETESGSMEYIHDYPDNQEMGELSVINKDGYLQYSGKLDKISGRGNSTWGKYKKPYSITLHEADALCGLKAGKKWNLLSLYYEHDKIHSKIIYDMARELGLAYTPECTWIDLYCNGEYKGLYLLTSAVTVADGRVELYDLDKDIEKANPGIDLEEAELIEENGRKGYQILGAGDGSGGYLIEKEIEARLKPKQAYFTTKAGYCFVLKSPKYASIEEVNYIADFIQNIEDMISEGNVEYNKYIDVDSFAQKFLVDLIAMDSDRMNMSMFFYKDRGKSVLYSGPAWDYDQAIGTIHPEYNVSVDMDDYGMDVWYLALYQREEFRNRMVGIYEGILSYMEKVLCEDIDIYANYIKASAAMDNVMVRRYREPDATISYKQHSSYIRYLKFYLANRLNYLNKIWKVECRNFMVPSSSGDHHEVVFKDEKGNVMDIRWVMDGECIEDFPVFNDDKYDGWFYDMEYSTRRVSHMMPIYEDIVFQLVLNPEY